VIVSRAGSRLTRSKSRFDRVSVHAGYGGYGAGGRDRSMWCAKAWGRTPQRKCQVGQGGEITARAELPLAQTVEGFLDIFAIRYLGVPRLAPR
jgi:hypothetical protein